MLWDVEQLLCLIVRAAVLTGSRAASYLVPLQSASITRLVQRAGQPICRAGCWLVAAGEDLRRLATTRSALLGAVRKELQRQGVRYTLPTASSQPAVAYPAKF